MKNGFKKLTLITLSALICASSFIVSGCKDEAQNTSQSGDQESVTIVLNEHSLELDLGETFTLVATVVGTSEQISWSSLNPAVATVDSNGKVVAVEEGETKIYATIGEDKAYCSVTVEEGASGLPTFYIDYASLTIYKDYTSIVEGVFMKGREELDIPANDIVWSSEDSTIASVEGGAITGIKTGTTTITASYVYEGQTYKDTIGITVKDLASYYVTVDSPVIASTTTYGGSANTAFTTSQLSIEKIQGTQVTKLEDYSGITFQSEDESVATVSAEGVITGLKAGKTNILVESADMYDTVEITVSTAINCKHDLDMLALAYARGEAENAWGVSAQYLLTQDIDYNGQIFLPIAANTGRNYTVRSVGQQWQKVLANKETYGISYEELVKKGLNADWTSDMTTVGYFNATLDGNGFAIKNAKLMLDACLGTDSGAAGYCTNFIGCLGVNGVLKNISVENLGVQTIMDLGYSLQEKVALPLNGQDITGDTYSTYEYNMYPGQIYAQVLGVFGYAAGTLENVYVEWNGNLGTQRSNRGMENYAFGRWEGVTKMTDCLFVDNYTEASGGSTYYSLCAVSTGKSFVADNLIIVSGHGRHGGTSTTSGNYTEYKSVDALQTAYNGNAALFDGYTDWEITLVDGVLTCDIKDGIAK